MLFSPSKKSVVIITFLLIFLSTPVLAKDAPVLPTAIQTKISLIPATKASWYIRKASGSKAGKIIYGPFENKEQAICVWLYFNLQENKGQCIAKNESFITKSPSVFYKKESEYIKSQITEYGIEAVLDKYFLGIELEIEEMPALIQSFQEIEEISETIPEEIFAVETIPEEVIEEYESGPESEPEKPTEVITEEMSETVVTPEEIPALQEEINVIQVVDITETTAEIENNTETSLSILNSEITEPLQIPEEISTITITEESSPVTLPEESITRYKKEYLQDYAPIKTAPLPSDEEEIVEYIIERPNKTDSKGRTLLMKACENGNDWEIENLLKSGANVNLKDDDGWTALMYGVRYQQNITIVKSLINAGAEIKAKNNFGLSALLIAATYNDNPEILKLLIKNYSVSEKELLQSFVMVLTSNTGNEYSAVAKVKVYLDAGIPLNVFYQGKTPLMYAASYTKSTGVIKLLLQNGAQTQIRSVDGKTAFDYANENAALAHDEYYWALNQK